MCSNKHKFRVRRDWDLLTAPLPPRPGSPDVFPMFWPKTRNAKRRRRKPRKKPKPEKDCRRCARVERNCSFLLPDCVITLGNDKDGWPCLILQHANRLKHITFHVNPIYSDFFYWTFTTDAPELFQRIGDRLVSVCTHHDRWKLNRVGSPLNWNFNPSAIYSIFYCCLFTS